MSSKKEYVARDFKINDLLNKVKDKLSEMKEDENSNTSLFNEKYEEIEERLAEKLEVIEWDLKYLEELINEEAYVKSSAYVKKGMKK